MSDPERSAKNMLPIAHSAIKAARRASEILIGMLMGYLSLLLIQFGFEAAKMAHESPAGLVVTIYGFICYAGYYTTRTAAILIFGQGFSHPKLVTLPAIILAVGLIFGGIIFISASSGRDIYKIEVRIVMLIMGGLTICLMKLIKPAQQKQ